MEIPAKSEKKELAVKLLESGVRRNAVASTVGLSHVRVREIELETIRKTRRLELWNEEIRINPTNPMLLYAPLSVRCRNCILNAYPEILTIFDLRRVLEHDVDRLMQTPNFGAKSIQELYEFVDQFPIT